MNAFKKLIPALFAALALAGCIVPQAPEMPREFSYAAEGMTFSYARPNYGSASITGYTGPSEAAIPAFMGDVPVEYIDHGGVFADKGMTGLQLPLSLVFIGDDAFRDNKLKALALPGKLKSIGNRAFANNGLEAVDLPGPLGFIGSRAFYKNSLAGKVVIPSGLHWLGELAFFGNEITELEFAPNSVLTIIHAGAFQDNALTGVVIPNSVERIGSEAFVGNQIVSVAIGANVNLVGLAFGGGFEEAYAAQGKKAGTYWRTSADSAAWSFLPTL